MLTYLVIGISGLISSIHRAPAIALAELSLTVEAIVMLIILNHRMKEPVKIDGILLKGLVAALLVARTYILA